MSKPAGSHMEAYLQQLGISHLPSEPGKLESEYLRSIYKVLPRKRALSIPLKQARSETAIKP